MSHIDPSLSTDNARPKSLWPVAAVILLVVFLPAVLAWGISMLRGG